MSELTETSLEVVPKNWRGTDFEIVSESQTEGSQRRDRERYDEERVDLDGCISVRDFYYATCLGLIVNTDLTIYVKQLESIPAYARNTKGYYLPKVESTSSVCSSF